MKSSSTLIQVGSGAPITYVNINTHFFCYPLFFFFFLRISQTQIQDQQNGKQTYWLITTLILQDLILQD